MRLHKIRRVVVLGHDGFIGTRLCESLRVRYPDLELIGLALGSIDLTGDDASNRLIELFDRSAAVIVLAGIKKQLGDTLGMFIRNMAIATNVCRAIEASSVRRILFVSSAEVYGEHTDDMAITERTPVRTTSYYGAAKFASEGVFRKAAAAAGASLAILRPPLVYGPGDTSASYGPSRFTRAAVRKEQIALWGDGLERREFLYVDDLVAAMCRLLFSNATGVVNVASGCSATFRDVLDALQTVVGSPLAVTSRPRTRPRVDQGYRNDRLRALMPDLEFTVLREGIRGVVESERLKTGDPAA